MTRFASVAAYLILAPFLGGLLDGIDRIISARMQRRKGPPLLQPFYDLKKLFSKQMIAVNNVQMLLNLSYLVFLAVAGAMLFGGMPCINNLAVRIFYLFNHVFNNGPSLLCPQAPFNKILLHIDNY